MTQDALLLIPLPDRSQPDAFALGSVTSVEFHVSVLGHSISWTGGAANEPALQTTIGVPVMVAASSFAAAALVRQALTLLPIEAAGPEMAVDSDSMTDGPLGSG